MQRESLNHNKKKYALFQIPNALARSQFLDRLDKMLKQYTAKFLRTLDPADLQPTLKALLDGVDPLDGNFNEMSLKAFLMGLLHPHRSEVDVINEPRLKDGSRRADLLLTHRDGRQVLIECKTLMPHQLSLPGFKDTRTTHFWSINDKKGVHKVLCGMARSDLLQPAGPPRCQDCGKYEHCRRCLHWRPSAAGVVWSSFQRRSDS